MSSADAARVAELAGLLKVLSDPTRLAILDRLMQGVQCNCELGECLDLPMNLISHHLKALRRAGLVSARRDPSDRRWVYYSVNREALVRLQREVCAFFDPGRVQVRETVCRRRVGVRG